MVLKSYRELEPLEYGGEIARNGFLFQDHVAAYFLIQLAIKNDLKEVWCETHDDITLIWERNSNELFEFIQVKSNENGQLWSIAQICERKKNEGKNEGKKSKPGTSILERSLSQDRGKEKCGFRLVTAVQPNNDLKILKHKLDSTHRKRPGVYANLFTKLSKKINNFESPNGNNYEFWVKNVEWNTWQDQEHIEIENLKYLEEVCEGCEAFLVQDQRQELYKKILSLSVEAATAKHESEPEKKKIEKSAFLKFLDGAIKNTQHPAKAGKSKKLREKMERGRIPEAQIQLAIEDRQYYRRRTLSPGYLTLDDREDIEATVRQEMKKLLYDLDAGVFQNGSDFHQLCLKKMEHLAQDLSSNISIQVVFLTGYMYETTDRCAFRFSREVTV